MFSKWGIFNPSTTLPSETISAASASSYSMTVQLAESYTKSHSVGKEAWVCRPRLLINGGIPEEANKASIPWYLPTP
jgi:hypothetical protein